MKIAMIIFFLYSFLGAYEYDKLLLRAEAYTLPKIVVLDKDYHKKLNNNSIEIAILHEPIDELVAIEFKKMIKDKFGTKVSASELEIELVEFDKLDKKYSAYIALKSKSSTLEKIALISREQGRIMFVYDYKDLEKGALVSLAIENYTNLYLNKSEIKYSKIDFNSAIFSIVRLW